MTSSRRDWMLGIAASVGSSLLEACRGGAPAKVAQAPAPTPLRVRPIAGLVPAAGLAWLIQVRPRELFAAPDLVVPLGRLVPAGGLDAFRETTGIDLRTMPSGLVAGLDRATLWIGEATFDPALVEARFRDRLLEAGPRATPRLDLVRIAGRVGSSLDTLVLLGHDAVAVGIGDPLAARAVEAYALGKLKSPSALAAPPLRDLAASLGDAPVLAFAPGPFEGEWAHGARGLLQSATAAGLAATLAPGSGLRVKGILAGDFARDPARAADVLAAAWNDLAASPLGRLAALDKPRRAPTVTPAPNALVIEVELDALALLRGLEDAVASQVRDIVRLPGDHAR